MTARELLQAARPPAARVAAWAWGHRTLMLALALVAAVALGLGQCRRAGQAEATAAAAAARSGGEAKAAAAGVPVVPVVPQPAVDEERDRLARENPLLQAELARARKALGAARAELAARIRAAPAPAAVPVPKGASLLLGADLVLDEGLAAGEYRLHGTLEARLEATGELVAQQLFSAPATLARRAPPEKPCPTHEDRLQRVGLVGGASVDGWLAGGAYTRRLDVWRWHPEGLVTAAAGPGSAVILAGILF